MALKAKIPTAGDSDFFDAYERDLGGQVVFGREAEEVQQWAAEYVAPAKEQPRFNLDGPR